MSSAAFMDERSAPPRLFDSARPSAVSLDPSVRRSAQDDEFIGGLEYNRLNMQKTRKDRKVTGSQDDDFVGI
jgi:hypothetical protein